jgi:NAD(P)-dependent dehydrogenase (short-subunit alcohol dehydrogenase family)
MSDSSSVLTTPAAGMETPPSSLAPLAGMNVLVTGGGRGLGAEISASLARAGARVAIAGRTESSLASWAAALPNDPAIIVADLSDPDAPSVVLRRTISELGWLDVLVNNAGVGHFGPSDKLTAQAVDATFAINIRAPLLLAGAAAAHMAGRRGGSIVNITSGLGKIGSSQGSLYAASKGALDAATRALAAEWGAHGVRVNGVRAGLVRSDATTFLVDDDQVRARYEQSVPLRRIGGGTDIADAVLFLASPAASYITGHILDVDGGVTTTSTSPIARE